MKNNMMLAAVSAIALTLAVPALAQTYIDNSPMANAATLSQIRAPILDEAAVGSPFSHVMIDSQTTADEMLGKPVYDTNGKRIAIIDDIIINDSGQATTVVLSKGGFLGIGDKLAGFDYNLVARRDTNGDIISPLTSATIKQAVIYSYDRQDVDNANTTIMPVTSHRLSKIIDGTVTNASGKEIADVDNASLQGGFVDYIIAGFDKKVDLTGKKIAFKYKEVSMGSTKDTVVFQLSDAQAARFAEMSRLNISMKK